MAGTKRKSISNSPKSTTKKTISTPDSSSDLKSNNKRKLSDAPLPISDKKSNRAKTPTKKILESGILLTTQQQSPQSIKLTTAEQRQRAIEWAKEVLPNTRKTPSSTKKEVSNVNNTKAVSPVIEPNSKKSSEKTITVPAINTPVPKKSGNTAQKRIRTKEISITIDNRKSTTNSVKPLLKNESYPLPMPGTQGFVYAIPIFIIAVYFMYLRFFAK